MKYIFLSISFFYYSTTLAQTIVLATYQYADNSRIENIKPLSKYLFDSLGLNVEVKSYPTVHKFIEGIQKNEVDLALINTFGYLLLETSKTKYEMQPYLVLKVKAGAENNYTTAIVAREDFPLDTIKNLKTVAANFRLGLVSIGSTSGNLVPRLKMAAIGIKSPETEFKTVEYCENHKNTIDQLLKNNIDICAVGSTEYFNLLPDTIKSKYVKLLWLSSEIPLGPVLFHNRLPDSIKQKIVSHLLKLDSTAPTTFEAIRLGWSEAKQADKYIEIDKHYYKTFKKQFGSKKAMETILKQFVN